MYMINVHACAKARWLRAQSNLHQARSPRITL